MKRVISLLLVLIVFVTSFSAAAVETEDDTAAKALFRKYITGVYGTDNYMNYDELGEVNGLTYVYGETSEATDTFYTAVLGDYVFNKFYISFPYNLGLFIITDDCVYPLETAYGMKIITNEDLPTVAALTQRVSVHKMDASEKLLYNYLKAKGLYTSSNYSYTYVGNIGALAVATAKTNVYDYSETIGNYQVYSETNPWLFAMGTQLFIIGDAEHGENEVRSLKEACDEGIVSIEDVKELCDSKYVSGIHFGLPVTELTTEPFDPTTETVEPVKVEPTEVCTLGEVEPTAVVIAKPDDSGKYEALKKAIRKAEPGFAFSIINVRLYKKIKDNVYIVNYDYDEAAYIAEYPTEYIGGYCYSHSYPEERIFDKANMKLYSIYDAYYAKKLTSSDMKALSKLKIGVEANTLSLKAGESGQVFRYGNMYKNLKSSDTKVVKVDREGSVTALKKGTATINYTRKDGKNATCKVTVTTDPKLTKNGKTIKSITLKKGGSAKIRISGKHKSAANTYKSTKTAKIIADKSAEVITVKALKKGNTTLYVTVNGKKLELRVTVK